MQDRNLIDVVGRAEGLGRPLLYGTTSFFLEHFGFGSLEDMPRTDELPIVLRDRVSLGVEAVAEEDGDGEDQEVPHQAVGAEETFVAAESETTSDDGDLPSGRPLEP